MSLVTLTFDNGPTTTVTPQVLAELEQRNLTAWFCVVGSQLLASEAQTDLAREILRKGHRLVNHSLTHGTALGDDATPAHAQREICDMDQLMSDRLGDWGERWFRPFGRGGEIGPHIFSQAAVQHLTALDYSVLLWNNVPRDWEDPRGWVETALASAEQQTHTVVVLHDLETGAMAQLPRFLDLLDEHGHQLMVDPPESCVPIRCGEPGWDEQDLAALVYQASSKSPDA